MLAIGLGAGGCFIEGSAGYYGIKHDEVRAKTAKQFGVAFGVSWDMGVARAAIGTGGDIALADGYEDEDGTGYVAHATGPYYGRFDLALIPLGSYFTLDATAGVFYGNKSPAVVVYDHEATGEDCIAGCGNAVGFEDGKPKVGHVGFGLGGYIGPTIALANQGPGELRLTVAASVLRTNIAPRDPFTAVGAQVRLVYGFTQFGSKEASFATMWKNYSNNLDDDMSRHNKNQSEGWKRRNETQQRERKERERRRREGGN